MADAIVPPDIIDTRSSPVAGYDPIATTASVSHYGRDRTIELGEIETPRVAMSLSIESIENKVSSQLRKFARSEGGTEVEGCDRTKLIV